MKHLAFLTLLILLSVGCHHARVRLDKETPKTKGEVKMIHKRFWLGGMFPRKTEIDATKLCSSGVYEVDEYYRWQDAVWTQVTLGIYVPRTIKITCN
ncbi:MAG: hypothetical protein KBF93_24345, partial [Leptospiraceae bacterium]|nr:hypothetical protein [Leptospiraceae bacterium]